MTTITLGLVLFISVLMNMLQQKELEKVKGQYLDE